jgi:hypothetical protein
MAENAHVFRKAPINFQWDEIPGAIGQYEHIVTRNKEE